MTIRAAYDPTHHKHVFYARAVHVDMPYIGNILVWRMSQKQLKLKLLPPMLFQYIHQASKGFGLFWKGG